MSAGRKISPKDEYILLNSIADGGYEGKDRNLIASISGMSGSTLHGRLSALERSLFITRIPGTRPLIYAITHEGKQRLGVLRNSAILDGNRFPNKSEGLISLQKFVLKYPIEVMPSIHYATMEIQMKNWMQGHSQWKNCVEVVNGDKSVMIIVKQLVGENEYQLETMAREIAEEHIAMMEQVWQFKFGRPSKVGKPEFEIKSFIAAEEIDNFGWAPGVRDRSQFGGEFVFGSADEINSFKNVPREVRALWAEVVRLGKAVDAYAGQNSELSSKLDTANWKLDTLGRNYIDLVGALKGAQTITPEKEQDRKPQATGQEVA